MTSTMTRVAAADVAPGDMSKHVKYTFGMLLGVDDFTQEFTYLSGRDRWLARDLLGYGTAWGLSVAIERPPDGGPRLNVDRGVGLTPLGELVCVPSMQCAYLDPWLVKHRDEVATLLPDGGSLPIYAVLCYSSRPTDNVPVPGEPCRSEDELTAPSRLQDDFELELRLTPPAQVEETAIREFVALLRQVRIVDGPGTDLAAFVSGIRDAAMAAPAGSPPAAAIMGAPDPGLEIPSDALTDYLRAAFRLWVTEIRPKVRLDIGCGADECPPDDSDGCLLLAEVALPVSVEGEPRRWFLTPGAEIHVNEEDRPYLLHQRMLQEWAFGEAGAAGAGSPAEGQGRDAIIAAGRVDGNDANEMTKPPGGWSWHRLSVQMFDDGKFYLLRFPGFRSERRYVVKGTPIRRQGDRVRVFEVVTDEEIEARNDPNTPVGRGIYVRLVDMEGEGGMCPFLVEVSDFSGLA